MIENNDFQPDWVSAPGDTMSDILEERKLTSAEFAQRMGCTPRHANELLHGRATITIETARQLEIVLGSSAEFWMTREAQYREDIARLEREAHHKEYRDWLSELPIKDMIKFGWLKSEPGFADRVAACLRFFDMPNVATWRETYREVLEMTAFRTSSSFRSQPGAVSAWLRQGEIVAASIDCKPWDAKRFEKEFANIRPLTRKKNPNLFVPELTRCCAECGVAVAIVRAPTGCRASGATRFLSKKKALLLLSFRYLSDDHFWFSFFHEAGHLVLHGKEALFLEGTNVVFTPEEKEANEYAARVLIPSEFQTSLLKLRLDAHEVIKFARQVNVAPGIVVGQLQHLGRIKPNQLNTLKRRFKWGSD